MFKHSGGIKVISLGEQIHFTYTMYIIVTKLKPILLLIALLLLNVCSHNMEYFVIYIMT